MILGTDQIRKRIYEEKLIENLSKRELENPESVVIDLRIKKAFRLEGTAFLGVEERETPRAVLISEFNPRKKTELVLKPGEYVLTETIEKFNMPRDLFCIIKPRATLHRMGVISRQSIVDPTFSGTIHPALYNAGTIPVTIEMGARYVQVFFIEIKGGVSAYRGQWQGGRPTTEGRERQV